MTTPKPDPAPEPPCVPECRFTPIGMHPTVYHAEGCSKHDQDLVHKWPAPAPEPKGSEEPVDFEAATNYANSEWWRLKPPATVCDEREGNLARAHLALRAENERLRTQIGRIFEDVDHLLTENKSLRAELAQAREEIARLKERIASMDEDITAFGEADMALTAICNRERAARERAEEAVLHLEHRNHKHSPGACTGCERIEAILARAKEEKQR